MLTLATGDVDLQVGLLKTGDRPVQLTGHELAVLAYLAQRPNQDVSRDELLAQALDYADQVLSRAVDHTVQRLRSKIEPDAARPRHIITVEGTGYRFVPLDGPQQRLRIGQLDVDLDRLEVLGGDEPRRLSPIEGGLLATLARGQGRPVPIETLLREVWGRRSVDQRRLVTRALHRLRTKLEPEQPLQTLRGRGVVLQVDVLPHEPAEVPWTCPPPLTAMVGRHNERDRLTARLSPGALVTLVGPGGMGKTTLARAVASRWPRPARFVDLRPVHRDVLGALCAALGLDRGEAPLVHALRSAGDALVVLDNAEGCVDELRPLLTGLRDQAPSVGWLVTSREPLKARGESIQRLEGLPAGDAAALFRARSTSQEDPTALLEALQGIPLAIEIAAARANVLGVEALVDRLQDPLRVLRGGPAGPHASLEAVLSLSFDRLEPQTQRVLGACALVPEGLPLEAVEAIAPVDDVLDRLQQLVERSLMVRLPNGRLGFSLAVARYASTRLDGDAWVDQARRRLHAWYAQLAGGLHRAGWEPAPQDYSRLLPEVEGALRAVPHAAPDVGARILLWALPLLTRQSMHARVAHVCDRFPHRDLSAALLHRLLWTFSRSAHGRGDRDAALAWAQELARRLPSADADGLVAARALALEGPLQDPPQASLPVRLAWFESVMYRAEDPDHWGAMMRARLALVRRHNLPWDESATHVQLANGPGGGGSPDALRHAQRVADPYRVAGLPEPPSYYAILGATARRAGRLSDAVAYCTRAYELAGQLGSLSQAGWNAGLLGTIAGVRGDYDSAQQWFREASDCAERLGDPRRAALMEANLGESLRRLGRFDEARAVLRHAAGRLEGDVQHATPLRSLGLLELQAGNLETARDVLEQANAASPTPAWAALGMAVLAEVQARLDDPKAWQTLQIAEENAPPHRDIQGYVNACKVVVARRTGRPVEAAAALARAQALVQEMDLAPGAELRRIVEGLQDPTA